MFGDLNRAEIIGNITSDLQVKYIGNGSAVTSFGIATNRRYKSPTSEEWKEETTFHNIVVWGKQAEGLAERAHKGTRIYISGRLQTRSWDDAEGKKNYKTEITAEQLILLDRYERGPSAGGSSGAEGGFTKSNAPTNKIASTEVNETKPTKAKAKKDDTVIDPDDLPF
ncbi:MAG: single-stranded DNA-binding protein [bacterium]